MRNKNNDNNNKSWKAKKNKTKSGRLDSPWKQIYMSENKVCASTQRRNIRAHKGAEYTHTAGFELCTHDFGSGSCAHRDYLPALPHKCRATPGPSVRRKLS